MSADDTVSSRLLPWSAAASEEDWDALYEAQLPVVYNFFRYRVGASADIEDLTATTFEKAWRARHRYRHDVATFTTWLLTIARNVAIDHFRRRHQEEPLTVAFDVPSSADSPEQAVGLRSDVDRLAVLMGGLPAREREILALKYGA